MADARARGATLASGSPKRGAFVPVSIATSRLAGEPQPRSTVRVTVSLIVAIRTACASSGVALARARRWSMVSG